MGDGDCLGIKGGYTKRGGIAKVFYPILSFGPEDMMSLERLWLGIIPNGSVFFFFDKQRMVVVVMGDTYLYCLYGEWVERACMVYLHYTANIGGTLADVSLLHFMVR